MKNFLKILLAVLVFFVLFLVVFCAYKIGKEPRQTSVNLLNDTEKCLLILPLEINDSTYYFLWDTGCTSSYIDSDLVEEMNLSVYKRVIESNTSTVSGYVSDTFNVSKVSMGMGGFLPAYDFKHNKNNFFQRFSALDTRVRGVIGQNIISNYYWLFDLMEYKVTISKEQIPLHYNEEQDLTLSYYNLRKDSGAFVDLRIDSVNKKSFLFDTGYSPSLNLLGFKILPSFILHYDEAYHTKKYVMPVHDAKINYAYLLRDSILINDKELYNISLISEETFHKTNYITVNFVYQFEKMYYDPVNKEIKLMGFRNEENSLDDEKEAIEYLKAEEKKHMNKQ